MNASFFSGHLEGTAKNRPWVSWNVWTREFNFVQDCAPVLFITVPVSYN